MKILPSIPNINIKTRFVLKLNSFKYIFYVVFIILGRLFIAVLAIIVQSAYGQNRRQNYVPRGDISNDKDLVESGSKNGTGLPKTPPDVQTNYISFHNVLNC